MTSPSSPLPLATLKRRLASLLYDALLAFGVLLVGFFAPQLALGLIWQVAWPGEALLLHVFFLLGLYFVWLWRHGGQTLAMKAWRIRLVDRAGAPPTLFQLCLRYFLAWPSLLFYGAGIIWAFFDRERQFLHDRLSGTRLIVVPPTPGK
ncbi:MAG: RDD family protein [Rhodocyclaceae bacterium]|nr:RDD family protein [Rhodocyclaceae bacterium]